MSGLVLIIGGVVLAMKTRTASVLLLLLERVGQLCCTIFEIRQGCLDVSNHRSYLSIVSHVNSKALNQSATPETRPDIN